MFDNFNVNLRKKQRISNLYSIYSYSGILSIERTLSVKPCPIVHLAAAWTVIAIITYYVWKSVDKAVSKNDTREVI